ncbi:dihydrofolate reductase [Pontibacillus salicampi]|uniref:Dihydrofolate reductase n=1 Tax=Pontibacillus salicampi TaxID=1449801 RepID=A0ABV6LLP6_9BACI
MISFLVAMDHNRTIGKNNDLPWKLPEDLKFFKQVSMGKTIIMGRKTFESMNGPLPGRTNVVVTGQHQFSVDGVHVIHDLDTIRKWEKQEPEKEWLVIGGSHVFEQMIKDADRMYITWIEESFDGDTFFPAFNEEEWTLSKNDKGVKNYKNPYDYYFRQYDRK